MCSALPKEIVTWNPEHPEAVHFGECVIAIGIFDGVHLGHRTLLSEAREHARALGLPLVVVTFDRDPDEIFCKKDQGFAKLLSNAERLELLGQFTQSAVLSLPATPEVFGLEPDDFLALLAQSCTPRSIFVGVNFHFGKFAAGTAKDIEAWGRVHGCTCVPHELVTDLGDVVSSTRIRGLLEQGRVAEARELLGGRPHAIWGDVVHGRGEGTDMGFATANLDLSDNEAMLPREGVYAAYALVEGRRYPAAVNVGAAPSFDAATAPLEAHLLDFKGDLYGKRIKIEFEEWLRESRVFTDKDELIATVMGNIDWVRTHLGSGSDAQD